MINMKEKHNIFEDYSKKIFNDLKVSEYLNCSLSAENTNFTRINNAKIRQTTKVNQGDVSFDYIINNRKIKFNLPFSFQIEQDIGDFWNLFNHIRKDIMELAEDPYIVTPKNNGNSYNDYTKNKINHEEILNDILSNTNDVDIVGLLTSGSMIRANRNSMGQNHWYSSDSYLFDYSICKNEKAVKMLQADDAWHKEKFLNNLTEAKSNLEILQKEPKKLSPGEYKTYLAPNAVAELLNMFSWNGISRRTLEEGQSPIRKLFDKKHLLSNKFSLAEDFSHGFSENFNELGEVMSMNLDLIKDGNLMNLLTSSKSAAKYNLPSNNAPESEGLSAPIIKTGNLKQDDILKSLGTGLYISNLHYLNWSDLQHGRITGMTRFACFWVEDGEIVAPINDMRFDETIYNIFGDNLIELTDFSEVTPNNDTYYKRNTGASITPGLLVDKMSYTL